MTALEALNMIAKADFQPFGNYEWAAYGGCESENPMIHYADEVGEEYTIILDGTDIRFLDRDLMEYRFSFVDKN